VEIDGLRICLALAWETREPERGVLTLGSRGEESVSNRSCGLVVLSLSLRGRRQGRALVETAVVYR